MCTGFNPFVLLGLRVLFIFFLSESVTFSVCLCRVKKSRAQRTLLVTTSSLFTCRGHGGGVPRGREAEVQCGADVQPGGSQPEARNGSSPSSQSGLWAGGETAPQIQGTGQWVWALGKLGLCKAGQIWRRGFHRRLLLPGGGVCVDFSKTGCQLMG